MSGSGMSGVQRSDHAGVAVDDLELVTAFFAGLGVERGNPMRLEGEWIDRSPGSMAYRCETSDQYGHLGHAARRPAA